ncbi:MAG TPA: helix-turn-helix transcriptional regulator [Planococcus sp. (in: firmicutes)]|nr:helix-turn-helix transcriptional regulator [Planococcus sp. (in: firmicutes)]
MNTGMRLKYQRLKKRMSLEETASEILSVKDLKKYETGDKEPSLDILEQLCKRLNIPLAPKDNPVGKVLVKNFKSSLLHPQNKGKIMEHYADIHDHPLLHSHEDVELEYSIQQIRYFIITGDLDSAEDKIKEMYRFQEFMNQEQYYLYHKYLGNYHYLLNDHDSALKTYLMAEKIAPPTIPASEMGDLYYSIGISSAQCWETEMASKYSEMALKIYQQEFIPKRIVECHSNIALAQFQFGNFKLAAEHYLNAYTIGRKLENDVIRFTTEFNLAYTYYLLQDYEASLEHMKHTLSYIPKEYTADILLSHCVLIKCNVELKNSSEALNWAEKGVEIIKVNKLNFDSPTNQAFKEGYLEIMALYNLIQENYIEFEELVVDKLIPSLKLNNNFYEIGYYYALLGDVYYELGEYKKSSESLKIAKQAFQNLIVNKKRSEIQ